MRCLPVAPLYCTGILSLSSGRTRHVYFLCVPPPPPRVLPRYCELQMHDRNKIPAFSKLPWILVST